MKKVVISLFIVLLLGISMQANANLTVIGQAQYGSSNYNLIWDDAPFGSIVWLDYTNNINTWQNQMDWASGLNSGGVLTYNIDPTYSVTWNGDWRLPSTVDGSYVLGYDGTTTAGWNITSSEMGHLYYTELGNQGQYDTSGNIQAPGNPQAPGTLNKGVFTNLQPALYWSETESTTYSGSAWYFSFGTSIQATAGGGNSGLGISVRPGDVTVVPEPISSTLFIVGAGLLVGRRYLKRKN